LAPLCESACEGPAPDAFPTGPNDTGEAEIDPRWAPLAGLELGDDAC
jgi:uncharacterized metal-binding protein YceD (DUF177 family)